MPKKLIKKYMPNHQQIREHKTLSMFGTLLHSPMLWHFNRRSVSGAFAVGLFCAFIPVPMQMAVAAAIAIIIKVNLPLAVALVWISNPITMPPLFYAAYKFGAFILNRPEIAFEFSLSIDWLTNGLMAIWEPFLLGCLLLGIISAAASYFIIRMLWRYQIIKEWQARKHAKLKSS